MRKDFSGHGGGRGGGVEIVVKPEQSDKNRMPCHPNS